MIKFRISISFSFLLYLIVGCNNLNTNSNSNDEYLLHIESKNFLNSTWTDSSYCNQDFNIVTPMPLDKLERSLPPEIEKEIQSLGYYIFQTKDNLLIQLICTSYKPESISGFDFKGSYDTLLFPILENAYGEIKNFSKQEIKINDYEGYLTEGEYISSDEPAKIKMAVLFKDFSLWQLLIMYNHEIKEQRFISEKVFESILSNQTAHNKKLIINTPLTLRTAYSSAR